ncbi:uncharacterized protein LOC115422271 [Sphaeramia orbicularis]|uniref:uncharacterized protein LOC115422271 n=1 Tax=Sphaeramia orbicularis TaxID=375764 RepID=UPI001180072C|nr:uncharacterized protein LOC115422271 [Sphaeramia orbicularis]
MNSLVGYGVSSDSDSDPEDVNNTNSSTQKELAVTKTRNFLLESGSASSDSEEEDPQLSSPPAKTLTPEPAPSAASQSTLPAPSLASPTSNKLPPPPLHTSIDSSVFANPFKAQADQKLSALQKHVPLTIEAKRSHIGGKRVCEAYRKNGRCRFDTKCKFAHDSGLQTPVIPTDSHSSARAEARGSSEARSGAIGSNSQSSQQETAEEESEGQKVKKRRVGLSNSLIPPKRALKQYAMQKDRERINMS